MERTEPTLQLKALLCAVIALASVTLQGCATVKEQDTREVISTAEVGRHRLDASEISGVANPTELRPDPNVQQRTVVLLRLKVNVDGKPLDRPASTHFGSGLPSFPILRISRAWRDGYDEVDVRPHFPAADPTRSGWLLLSLEPSRYELSFQSLAQHFIRWGPGVHEYSNAQRISLWGPFQLQVPQSVSFMYAGTLTLECTTVAGGFWDFGVARYACSSEQILDETDQARQLAAASLAPLGPLSTALILSPDEAAGIRTKTILPVEPDYAMGNCPTGPAVHSLGEVLGVFIDLRQETQVSAAISGQGAPAAGQAVENKFVQCLRDALHDVAPKLRPIGISMRFTGADNPASLREMRTSILTRLSDPSERGELTASGMHYLVAIAGLSDQWSRFSGAFDPQAGMGMWKAWNTDTYVDVLLIDVQEGCLLHESGFKVSSSSAVGAGLLLGLPVPIAWPAADTEGETCRVVAKRVAKTLAGTH